jgi:hypothetical protein
LKQIKIAGGRLVPACDLRRVLMCEKCVELDSKIEHYRALASRITDQPTLDGISHLTERMRG